MFDLGGDARLQAYDMILFRVQISTRTQLFMSTWSRPDMPAHRVSLAALFDTLVSSVSVYVRFSCVKSASTAFLSRKG
jgi:hypothetical protein